MATANNIYRVSFLQQGKVFEVYARRVSHGAMAGFLEVEELLFGERSQVVLDPSEEKLKSEFKGVQRFFLPLHWVLRVDEVEKRGTARIRDADGEGAVVSPFPVGLLTPQGDSSKS